MGKRPKPVVQLGSWGASGGIHFFILRFALGLNQERTLTTLIETRGPQMFPTLRPAQLARLEGYGKRARVEAGEILAQSGEREGRLVVVLTGSVEILRTGLSGDERVILHGPGEFTGELSTLRGARSLVRCLLYTSRCV